MWIFVVGTQTLYYEDVVLDIVKGEGSGYVGVDSFNACFRSTASQNALAGSVELRQTKIIQIHCASLSLKEDLQESCGLVSE